MRDWLLVGCCLLVGVALGAPKGKASAKPKADPNAVTWKLAFTENFEAKKLNEKLWTRIDKGNPDWCKNMSLRPDLVAVKGGQLHCYGVKNDDKEADPRAVLCGGVMTQHKFAVQYGKVEVRVKLAAQKGAWPAIWMMPEKGEGGWPMCGEIDIIERLNADPFVYQTVHSAWTQGHPNDPPRGGRGSIKPDDWNVYAIEWTPEEIVWLTNGVKTHSYRKVDDSRERWPWTYPFYLMIDMQLGGSWVGAVDESTLPTAMHVDWVKFYAGTRAGKKFTVFERPGVPQRVSR